MSRDVHSCTHLLGPCNPRIWTRVYEGAIGSQNRRHLIMTPWGWVLADFVIVPDRSSGYHILTYWKKIIIVVLKARTIISLQFSLFRIINVCFRQSWLRYLENVIILYYLLTYRQSDILSPKCKINNLNVQFFPPRHFFIIFRVAVPLRLRRI